MQATSERQGGFKAEQKKGVVLFASPMYFEILLSLHHDQTDDTINSRIVVDETMMHSTTYD
jgi:hypothetical protein